MINFATEVNAILVLESWVTAGVWTAYTRSANGNAASRCVCNFKLLRENTSRVNLYIWNQSLHFSKTHQIWFNGGLRIPAYMWSSWAPSLLIIKSLSLGVSPLIQKSHLGITEQLLVPSVRPSSGLRFKCRIRLRGNTFCWFSVSPLQGQDCLQ